MNILNLEEIISGVAGNISNYYPPQVLETGPFLHIFHNILAMCVLQLIMIKTKKNIDFIKNIC